MPLRMAVPKSPTWCQRSVSTFLLAVVWWSHTTAQDRQGEGFLAGVLSLLVFKPLCCLGLDGQCLLQDPVGGQVACHWRMLVGFWEEYLRGRRSWGR
jgi:hypothetical protein